MSTKLLLIFLRIRDEEANGRILTFHNHGLVLARLKRADIPRNVGFKLMNGGGGVGLRHA